MVYKDLCSKVSEKYHSRIKEIVSILDPEVRYTVKSVGGNLTTLKHYVKTLSDDHNGYKNLKCSIVPLNGKAIIYPHIKLQGEFIVILIKNTLFDQLNNEVVNTNTLLVYEEVPNLIKSGGVNSVGVYS